VRQEQSGGSGCRQVRAGEHSTRGKEIPNPDGFSGLAPIHGVPNEINLKLTLRLEPCPSGFATLIKPESWVEIIMTVAFSIISSISARKSEYNLMSTCLPHLAAN